MLFRHKKVRLDTYCKRDLAKMRELIAAKATVEDAAATLARSEAGVAQKAASAFGHMEWRLQIHRKYRRQCGIPKGGEYKGEVVFKRELKPRVRKPRRVVPMPAPTPQPTRAIDAAALHGAVLKRSVDDLFGEAYGERRMVLDAREAERSRKLFFSTRGQWFERLDEICEAAMPGVKNPGDAARREAKEKAAILGRSMDQAFEAMSRMVPRGRRRAA